MNTATRLRAARQRPATTSAGPAALLAIVLLVPVLGVGALSGGYFALRSGLPDVETMSSRFGVPGTEHFRPVELLDRTSTETLYTVTNPAAEGARWLDLRQIPDPVLQALVRAIDPGFWGRSGWVFDSGSIPARLVTAQLLPMRSPLERAQVPILATDLVQRFSDAQILEWYLNSADFGNSAYGLDAAARTYFGVATEHLSRGQAVRLAAAALAPDGAPDTGWSPPEFVSHTLVELEERIGRGALGRSGLKLTTTYDEALMQVCAATADCDKPGNASVVIDSSSGELLAASGPFAAARPVDRVLYPFTYLTALAQGAAPATMVYDLSPPLEQALGPISLREALRELVPGAERWTRDLVGAENVARIREQMGLDASGLSAGRQSLIQLAYAFSILAAEGERAGSVNGPTSLLEVEDFDGRTAYRFVPGRQSVVSAQLAYLMLDMLASDIGRIRFGDEQWRFQLVPGAVVASWGHSETQYMDRVEQLSPGAGGWQRPEAVVEAEVCVPSGLLATDHCPEVVKELFVEPPTRYDDLYRPLRINRETGKLATLFTPLDRTEERVYFVPPEPAVEWAEVHGFEVPPDEYDPLPDDLPSWPGVSILSPSPFDVLGAETPVLGEADPEGFSYYRLQYGRGLNPTGWTQIGTDVARANSGGMLGAWDTSQLNGLYTLQLLVVLGNGEVRTAVLPVTVDSDPPGVVVTVPADGERIRLSTRDSIMLEVSASDAVSLDRVELLVNGRRLSTLHGPPHAFEWVLPANPGMYSIIAHAIDSAGNRAASQPVHIELLP